MELLIASCVVSAGNNFYSHFYNEFFFYLFSSYVADGQQVSSHLDPVISLYLICVGFVF